MPLTEFQKFILAALRHNRNPNSYVAGGIAINRLAESGRHSNDIDFFQDNDESVAYCSTEDIEQLKKLGLKVQTLIQQPSFVRVLVSDQRHSLKLEWVRDTAFRFFPVVEDAELGYRLHDVDLIINKCLTLANRNEVRDIIDILQLEGRSISIAAACWAACGKDPGFTPTLLLDMMRKNSIIRSEQLAAEALTTEFSAVELKKLWIEKLDAAANSIKIFPAQDLGCLYLSEDRSPVPKPERSDKLATLIRHFGSVGGSWPRVVL